MKRFNKIILITVIATIATLSVLIPVLILNSKSPVNYCLSISITGEGTTDPDPGSHYYPEGTKLEINAYSYPGSMLEGWHGDASGNETKITIIIDGDKDIIANFVEEGPFFNYSLTIEIFGGGGTDPGEGVHIYRSRTIVYVTAISNAFWVFEHWFISNVTGDDNPIPIVMNSNRTLQAYFREV